MFGPSAAAARLEGSKAFAKEVMEAAGVPTAAWRAVTTVEAGMAAIERYPVVLKLDGLAAGKGVVIAADEARGARRRSSVPRRASASAPGAWSSRSTSTARSSRCSRCATASARCRWRPAQDYKRIFDGDEGPNTGGMGAYAPVPGIDRARDEEMRRTMHQPVVDELAAAAPRSTACSTPG